MDPSRSPVEVHRRSAPGAARGADRAAPTGLRCHAPSTSMYLGQTGMASACAASQHSPLGSVVDGTLRAVWDGAEARALRLAHAASRSAPACVMCEWQAAEAGPDTAYARLFDHLPMPETGPETGPEPATTWPAQLEFALANTCNLQCVMCSGDLSSSIRAHRDRLPPLPAVYGDRFFAELAGFLPHLRRAKFLGGEPFLVREHHRVWDLMIDAGLEVPCHVTTNGTQWNDRVARVLEHLPVSIAVSMDGIRPATVEAIRAGASMRTLLRNLDRFSAYVEERGTDLCLTFTLMRANWQEFDDFLRFVDDRGLDVFVNVLTRPHELSLYALPAAELSAVVAALDRRDARAQADLGPSLRVWDEQLTRLRARLDGLGQGTTVGAVRPS